MSCALCGLRSGFGLASAAEAVLDREVESVAAAAPEMRTAVQRVFHDELPPLEAPAPRASNFFIRMAEDAPRHSRPTGSAEAGVASAVRQLSSPVMLFSTA